MAETNFALPEDIELSKKEKEENSSASPVAPQNDPNPQIKNAHATGDGSFGRNDESLPDETQNPPIKKEEAY